MTPKPTTESILRTIPDGWQRVLSGSALYGDRWWNVRLSAWLPVTDDDWLGEDVEGEHVSTVIRKQS